MKKIFSCVIMFFAVAVLFSGCSTINLSTVTSADGTVTELVTLYLDSQKTIEYGLNPAEIKQQIKSTAEEKAKQIYFNFVAMANGDILLSSDQETVSVLSTYRDGLKITGDVWEGDRYQIGLQFPSQYAYNYFYNITSANTVAPVLTKKFFYTRVEYTGFSLYARYSTFQNNITAEITQKFPQLTDVTPTYTYTMITDKHRQHSNADLVQSINGEYYHTWIISAPDQELTLYYNIANPESFIYVSLAITLLVALILTIVVIIIQRKKHKKNKESNPQDEKEA